MKRSTGYVCTYFLVWCNERTDFQPFNLYVIVLQGVDGGTGENGTNGRPGLKVSTVKDSFYALKILPLSM